ncbi:MAG TPA: MG2 domain-containing protein, partial [Polyangiales bacterium]|nr:MG2 domain-containing protein [Polyangiales bacterium]
QAGSAWHEACTALGWAQLRPSFEETAMFKRLSCLAVLLALAAVGCGSDTTKHDPVPKADSASNGVISVSEAGLHAVLRGSELDVAIPVRALMQAEGALSVELRSVDGKKVSDETSVSYSLHTGEKKSLSAHLRLPKDVVAQADRALYSVHVSEARSRPLHVTRSLLYVLTPYSLVLEGPARLRTAKPGSYRVRMEDPTTHAPLANAEVSLLLSKGDTMVKTLTGTTDADGSAVFQLDAADVGMYKVSAQTEESNAKLQLVEDLTVDAPGQKLLITTDKPIYQPGQLMHLRALALTSPDNKPVAKQSVDFDITDGKGNKVFKKSVKTDDFGIASTTFRLASLVNMGNYGVHATLGETKGEKSVSVSRYVLPKFDVKVGTDAAFYAPGAKVSGTIDARYFFGKDVGSAKVLVEALTLDVGENVFQQVMGMADKNGHTTFEVTLPGTLAGIPLQDGNALVTLRVTVTDSAGQVVVKEKALTVAQDPIRITLVPENTVAIPGVENRFHLFATDPLGEPIADATVDATLNGGAAMHGTTDPFGHVALTAMPSGEAVAFDVTLTPSAGGSTIVKHFDFTPQTGGEHVLVRTDKSIYHLGDTVKVQVFASNAEDRVYVDWLSEGQAVDMRTLDVTNGTASFDMPLDASLFGENRIEAYVVDADGNTVRAGRTIMVSREGALQVSLSTDQAKYAPGEAAKLTFSVSDQQGKPAAAALGVQIVDEAVFALIDAKPGLLRTYFELEDAFAKPQYEIQGPIVNFEQLVFDDVGSDKADQAKAAQAEAEASLAALQGQSMMGIHLASWPAALQAALTKVAPFYD